MGRRNAGLQGEGQISQSQSPAFSGETESAQSVMSAATIKVTALVPNCCRGSWPGQISLTLVLDKR